MERVFRAIAVTVCGWIYPLIPPLYEVFYELASARYFTDSTINDLASNLYILVSVVMLFTFAIQLIKAIVNPDLLDDKKKGAKQTFFRCVIALFLIVLVPMGGTWQCVVLQISTSCERMENDRCYSGGVL